MPQDCENIKDINNKNLIETKKINNKELHKIAKKINDFI